MAALGTSFLNWLKTVWPDLHDAIIAIGAAIVQKKLDDGSDAKAALDAIQKADKAASPVDAMSDAGLLRDLQSRGRVRDL
ncbi:hypothetical protein QWJ07_04050 [Frankia sp. RB7]|nr:hypothetical protein [Frankia sp. RB7]